MDRRNRRPGGGNGRLNLGPFLSPEEENMVEGLPILDDTWGASMRPATEEESIAYDRECEEAYVAPPQHRFSARSLRRLIHLCLFLQLGFMIGNWIWYGIELQNSTVTHSHKLIHGALQTSIPPNVFARNIFTYSRDNRSGTCQNLGIMINQTSDSITVSLSRYGIESAGGEAQSQFENTTMSHHNLILDCDLVPGLHYGALFPALGNCIVLFMTLVMYVGIEHLAHVQSYDEEDCISLRNGRNIFLYGFVNWKGFILYSFYNTIKSSTEALENLMKADTIQIFDKTVSSLTWDRTQMIGQCCGIHDYNFWSINSSVDGYPKSCCNNLLFDCDSLPVVTANEVWKTGCLDSEVANVIWGLIPRIIFQGVDIIVEVCLLMLMNSYYYTLWDETTEQNYQRDKGMKKSVLTISHKISYQLPQPAVAAE